MIYYNAEVLKKIENKFFAIQRKDEKPDSYIELPKTVFV
jgi:hypothetical protein